MTEQAETWFIEIQVDAKLADTVFKQCACNHLTAGTYLKCILA